MRHPSQEKLRGLCLGLLVFAAFGCGEDPPAPANPVGAAVARDWTDQICQFWRRRDGSCDQKALIADHEDCMRTKAMPELERLRKAGRRTRARIVAQERALNLCLEQRAWVITDEGRAQQVSGPKPAAPAS
jgi:hypothetical protein